MFEGARRTCDRNEDRSSCTCMYYGWIRKESMYAIVTGPQCRRTCQEYHTDACRNTVSKPEMPSQGLTRTCWPRTKFITL